MRIISTTEVVNENTQMPETQFVGAMSPTFIQDQIDRMGEDAASAYVGKLLYEALKAATAKSV